MRIHRQYDDAFVTAFTPLIDQTNARVTSGVWAELDGDTNLSQLKAIQSQVIAACERRLKHYRESRERAGTPAQSDDGRYASGTKELNSPLLGTD